MSDFHQKRRIKRFLYSPVVLVPLAFAVFFLSLSVWNVYKKERETRVKRDKQEAVLEALEIRATALKDEITKLSTDSGREAEIRSKFEVAKEKERVIVIVDPEKEERKLESSATPSFWRRVWSWLWRI